MSYRCLQCGVDLGTAPATDMYCSRHKTDENAANARLIAAAPQLFEAGKKMWAFYNDLASSNPGFMGKLCLQNYQQWNEAMIAMPAALAAAEEAGQ